jgi:hypothetical protein
MFRVFDVSCSHPLGARADLIARMPVPLPLSPIAVNSPQLRPFTVRNSSANRGLSFRLRCDEERSVDINSLVSRIGQPARD